MPNNELLLRVEHVKYRSPTASRSPIGTFNVYEDRVEWIDNASDDKLIISFNDIRGQRISPPNKTKIQLQLCLHNEEQPTFVFVNPAGDREVHVGERDLVKETLQQALIRHRQLANQAAVRSQKYNKTREMEAKKKILEQNAHLRQLYKHLVASKLISAQDFWCDYYTSNEENDEEKLGVSGGFLSSIAQSEGTNGVKLNLNVDTIQSIFKTYPAVEKKHLELVPHEMTEQQFWSMFFQSHYFHRERCVTPNPADPFSDCVKADNREMSKMLELPITHKILDFSYLSDYSKTFHNGNEVPATGSGQSNKTLLMKRCNYHSGRVLMSAKEDSQVAAKPSTNNDDQQPSSSTMPVEEEHIAIESEELQNDKNEDIYEQVILSESRVYTAPVKYTSQQFKAFSELIQRLATDDSNAMDMVDSEGDSDDWLPLNDSSSVNGDISKYGDKQLGAGQSSEVMVVHDALAELLKHFWMCIPPNTPELEIKLDRMISTLKNFESSQLAAAESKFGSHYVAHCKDMLNLAYKRYEAYVERRKK
uniref:BSD domain-containing protein n=1 Tax=Parascaris univalens TaxID=6257 RepID=A0A915BLT5_PARUN